MIFKQLFDEKSSTYTYIVASGKGREALVIDPVIEHTSIYTNLLDDLDLKLVKVIDTHIHADHISAMAELKERTNCETIMGEHTKSEVVSLKVKDNEKISIDGIILEALYTPGHTDDSYCFVMEDRIFTGDTLLINGTGRTDFQNGNSKDAYNSLFKRLLVFPEETLVYSTHDYKGTKNSSIGNEKKNNPRLQESSTSKYAEIFVNLKLSCPQMLDFAVPANLHCLTLKEI